MKRVSSAGYRLQPRTTEGRSKSSQPRTEHGPSTAGDSASPCNCQKNDPVRQDMIWRELVWRERRKIKEWEKNWDSLENFDHLGQPKSEKPLPSSAPRFSDHLPSTNNQVIGSRLNTPLGREMVNLERLWFFSNRQHGAARALHMR